MTRPKVLRDTLPNRKKSGPTGLPLDHVVVQRHGEGWVVDRYNALNSPMGAGDVFASRSLAMRYARQCGVTILDLTKET